MKHFVRYNEHLNELEMDYLGERVFKLSSKNKNPKTLSFLQSRIKFEENYITNLHEKLINANERLALVKSFYLQIEQNIKKEEEINKIIKMRKINKKTKLEEQIEIPSSQKELYEKNKWILVEE